MGRKLTSSIAVLAMLMAWLVFPKVEIHWPEAWGQGINVVPAGGGSGGGGTVSVNNTVAVSAHTVFVATSTINAAAWLQNTAQVATSTLNAAVWLQNTAQIQALSTVPVSLPTIGVQVGTAQAAISATIAANAWIQNTPAVQPPYPMLASATTTNTVMPNVMITSGIFQHLGMGYDSTGSNNAYRAVSVDASGNQNANVKNTVQAAISATVNVASWAQNTVNIQALSTVPVSLPTVQAAISATIAANAWIQNQPTVSLGTADPCMNPNIAKSYFAMATPSATTTAVCVAAAGKTCYLCGFTFSEPQGVGTVGVQFLSASSTPCGSATPMTGKFTLGVTHPAPHTVATTSAGNSMCLQYTGAGVDPEGVVTFVQQ